MGARQKIVIPLLTVLATLALAELASWAALALRPDWAIPSHIPAETKRSPFELPETFGQLPRHPLPPFVPAGYAVVDDFPWQRGDTWTPPRGQTFTVHYRNSSTGELLWETKNTTDPQGRRLAPWQDERKKTARRHVFAAGCSLTWGHGVNDDETFLAQISKNHPDLITYNAGVGGYAISEILTRAQTQDVMDDIAPKEGIGIYVLFNDHLNRYANSAFVVGTWRPEGAEMVELGDGNFKFLGRIDEIDPLWSAFSWLWARSSFARLFHLDFPALTPKLIDRFMREVKAFRKIYREKTLPTNPFVVVIFPYDEPTDLLQEGLTRAEIPYLNYSRYNNAEFTEGPSSLKGDGHPSPELHAKLSIALERDLRAIMDKQLGKK